MQAADWKTEYIAKKITLEEIAEKIPDGSYIATSHAAAEPRSTLKAIADCAGRFSCLHIYNTHALEEIPYCTEKTEGIISYATCFLGNASRKAVQSGRADFITSYYSERPSLMGNEIPVDVAILSVSKPDEHGYCSFGITVDHQWAMAQAAKIVIAEINDQMPRTLGSGKNMIHIRDIDYIIEVSRPLPQLFPGKISEVEKAIGENCASLIRDGDTLQLGIGRIPDAVLVALTDKKDLGIHSEMISDGVMNLMEAGVVTNRKKTIDYGVSVVTFLYGTNHLYQFANNNPAISMRNVDYTNNPAVIAQHENFVSINSAIQIDLTGQVCAEAVNGLQFSGVGGQVDFIRGAALCKNGRAILAMPSTAKNGTVSRIALELDRGNPVTTTRNDVDYIITEYGIAKLRGKSMTARAEALISIAHPRFREALQKSASHKF